jgi:flagellar protein FlaG
MDGGICMRIDGMDAKSASLPRITGSDQTSVASTASDTTAATVTRESKGKDTENRNLTHLSDFERRELPISEKVVIDAIEKANKAISGANRKFEFSIHEKTKEIMIKVIDSDTNQVVREIPPEKILDMVAKMWEMAGLIVDERR